MRCHKEKSPHSSSKSSSNRPLSSNVHTESPYSNQSRLSAGVLRRSHTSTRLLPCLFGVVLPLLLIVAKLSSGQGVDEDVNRENRAIATAPPPRESWVVTGKLDQFKGFYTPRTLPPDAQLTYASVWAPWSAWSFCTNNQQLRVRACNTIRGFSCLGANLERRPCPAASASPQPAATVGRVGAVRGGEHQQHDYDTVDPWLDDRKEAMRQLYPDTMAAESPSTTSALSTATTHGVNATMNATRESTKPPMRMQGEEASTQRQAVVQSSGGRTFQRSAAGELPGSGVKIVPVGISPATPVKGPEVSTAPTATEEPPALIVTRSGMMIGKGAGEKENRGNKGSSAESNEEDEEAMNEMEKASSGVDGIPKRVQPVMMAVMDGIDGPHGSSEKQQNDNKHVAGSTEETNPIGSKFESTKKLKLMLTNLTRAASLLDGGEDPPSGILHTGEVVIPSTDNNIVAGDEELREEDLEHPAQPTPPGILSHSPQISSAQSAGLHEFASPNQALAVETRQAMPGELQPVGPLKILKRFRHREESAPARVPLPQSSSPASFTPPKQPVVMTNGQADDPEAQVIQKDLTKLRQAMRVMEDELKTLQEMDERGEEQPAVAATAEAVDGTPISMSMPSLPIPSISMISISPSPTAQAVPVSSGREPLQHVQKVGPALHSAESSAPSTSPSNNQGRRNEAGESSDEHPEQAVESLRPVIRDEARLKIIEANLATLEANNPRTTVSTPAPRGTNRKSEASSSTPASTPPPTSAAANAKQTSPENENAMPPMGINIVPLTHEPADAEWSAWSEWADCFCGKQVRTRICDYDPSQPSKGCAPGSSFESRACTVADNNAALPCPKKRKSDWKKEGLKQAKLLKHPRVSIHEKIPLPIVSAADDEGESSGGVARNERDGFYSTRKESKSNPLAVMEA